MIFRFLRGYRRARVRGDTSGLAGVPASPGGRLWVQSQIETRLLLNAKLDLSGDAHQIRVEGAFAGCSLGDDLR